MALRIVEVIDPFSPNGVVDYLDDTIRFWRSKREIAIANKDERELLIADCYIDANQSIRVSLYGELLP